MAIDFQIYDTHTLVGVMRQQASVPSFWLDRYFQSEITFEDEFIDFEKIVEHRKLAPFVMPTAEGKPMYSAGSELTRIKPAYVKPRDAVEATRQIRKKPGELGSAAKLTPAQRWDLNVADILRTHRQGTERRWEWMAARAVLDGGVTLEGDSYPTTYVDFKRDPNLTTTLGAGEAWDDGGNPIKQITRKRQQIRQADFGGVVNDLLLGSAATEAFLDNEFVLEQLNTDRRGTTANLNTGVRNGLEIEYLGTLGSGLECWSYSDYFEDHEGRMREIMDPRDAALVGDVGGVRAFGAIQDKRAGLQAIPIFPKMWDVEDPSSTQILSQSAPMMVPTMPNRSARMRVVA